MDFQAQELVDILISKYVFYLFHANTIPTACTFLRYGGLLSREYVENNNLYQTAQLSDSTDKIVGVWNDIFFDSCDLHGRMRNINIYGPILFKFNIRTFRDNVFSPIRVTKANPWYWKPSFSDSEKYFMSLDEVNNDFKYGTFGQMITFRNRSMIPLLPSLKEIIIDDPNVVINGLDVYSETETIIKRILTEINLQVPIVRRQCTKGCQCAEKYKQMYQTQRTTFERLFGLNDFPGRS